MRKYLTVLLFGRKNNEQRIRRVSQMIENAEEFLETAKRLVK